MIDVVATIDILVVDAVAVVTAVVGTGVASVPDVVGMAVGYRFGWPAGFAGWSTAGIRW